MSLKVNLHDAKARLSHYLTEVERGETVIICRRNVPIAVLAALPRLSTGLRLGVARGEFRVPPTFFEPLPEDILGDFEGSRP